jgi:hypothetical protein
MKLFREMLSMLRNKANRDRAVTPVARFSALGWSGQRGIMHPGKVSHIWLGP